MPDEINPPDVEGALRTYLRADSGVQAVMGASPNTRVFFGADDPAYPWAAIQRIGGGDNGESANMDHPLVQIDCYGDVHDKASAWAACKAVVGALRKIMFSPYLGTGVTVLCDSTTFAWLPDLEAERARYSVTAALTVAAV